ncbi:MAG: glycosyltransferase family 1 protein [Actinobacteria bacterium]|nr:glycosyltransferase family 1 protein [Actinomycetota bacterium]
MQTALLTLRRIRPVPWFGAFVDAEDVLVTGLGAQLHEVDLADARWARRPLASAHLHRLLAAARLARPHRIVRPPGRPDVMVVLANDLHDLAVLPGLPGWDAGADTVIVYAGDVNERDLRLHPDVVHHLRRHVDVLLTCVESTPLERLRSPRLRTIEVIGGLLDVLAFPSRPAAADRPIDVVNLGRRSPQQHALLLRWADQADGFYLYDTGYLGSLHSLAEHRRLYTGVTSRSRVFITNYAAVGDPKRGFPSGEVGFRFYEAMAAGCVLAGDLPTASRTYRTFIAPADPIPFATGATALPGELLAVLEDPAEQECRGRASRALALRHLDIAHRWKDITAVAGLPPSPGIDARVNELARLASSTHGHPHDR